jgi:AcrR family transcriptional regulator
MAGRRGAKEKGGAKARRGAGVRPPLTRERILAAGIELLERAPEAELSMRGLAAELGTAPMSLYRHVENREDLLDGINRLALESLRLEVPEQGEWRERALAWMRGLRVELHAHPAVAPLLRLQGTLAPTLIHVLQSLLRVMLDAGFEGRQAALAVRVLTWFTMSFATNEIARGAPRSDPGSFEALSAENLGKAPELAALLPHFADIDVDEIFEASAAHLLDGPASRSRIPP